MGTSRRLTREDWAEIYAALDSKKAAIFNGAYGDCLKHGNGCSACDRAWTTRLSIIMDKIGPDGIDALAAQSDRATKGR